jgi:hypothetical protein
MHHTNNMQTSFVVLRTKPPQSGLVLTSTKHFAGLLYSRNHNAPCGCIFLMSTVRAAEFTVTKPGRYVEVLHLHHKFNYWKPPALHHNLFLANFSLIFNATKTSSHPGCHVANRLAGIAMLLLICTPGGASAFMNSFMSGSYYIHLMYAYQYK